MDAFLAYTVVGIVTGCIYAVAASGLVVTYTTSGIFNFAHGAEGMLMAFVFWYLRVHQHWPTPLALIVVLFVLAPLMGAVIERTLMRKLHGSSTGVALVVTLALLVFLLTLAQNIWPPREIRTLDPFFNGHAVKIFSVVVTYHQLIVLAVAVAIAVFLRLLLFHTRVGVTMRAVVDNRELSALNGAYPERVAQLSWALGAMLAATAGILIAPTIYLDHVSLTFLVVNGYAAAMLGRLRSLPLTFAGAIGLGLLNNYAIGYGGSIKLLGDMRQILPTVFLFGVLVFLPQAKLTAGRLVGARTPRVPSLRESAIAAVVFVGAVGILSGHLSDYWTTNLAEALVTGIVLLSLVLLTGYGGQVSLMQFAFVGVGAITMGQLASGGSPVGLLLAAVLAAAFGAIVALPALRLQDLYLALTTLAFAEFAEWAFNQNWLLSRGGSQAVPRLRLPGVSFQSEQAQLVLCAVVFVLVGVLVLTIRRGPYGRRLTAMKDSPIACATLGMNVVTTKMVTFALSAGIAGVAGALFGGLHTTVSAGDFPMLRSLFLFLVATFGGVTTVVGALFGGVFLAVIPEIGKQLHLSNLQGYAIALGAISLADNPHGLGGNIAMAGDAIRGLRGRMRGGPVEAPPPAVAAGGDATIVVREHAEVGR